MNLSPWAEAAVFLVGGPTPSTSYAEPIFGPPGSAARVAPKGLLAPASAVGLPFGRLVGEKVGRDAKLGDIGPAKLGDIGLAKFGGMVAIIGAAIGEKGN